MKDCWLKRGNSMHGNSENENKIAEYQIIIIIQIIMKVIKALNCIFVQFTLLTAQTGLLLLVVVVVARQHSAIVQWHSDVPC